jgi:hypothetical protein
MNFNDFKSPEDFEKFIENKFPNWLVCSLDNYCNDYPHFQKNWETICNKLNTSPKHIVLVNKINFENKDDPLLEICEFMTKNGYVVRRYEEFIPCKQCYKAIPCKEIWQLLKHKNIIVPSLWDNKCSTC